MDITISPSALKGSVEIPASKSHTIRALIIASLAEGTSIIKAPLVSRDTEACKKACSILGADIQKTQDGLKITGIAGAPSPPEEIIDVQNSGTTLYLLTAIAALTKGWTIFTGDKQIRRRSAQPLLEALNNLGAKAISSRNNGCAPLMISGPLQGGYTKLYSPTSQYLSALLIACPMAEKESTIELTLLKEHPYIDMTLWWLNKQKIKYSRENYKRFTILSGQKYTAFTEKISGDYSSATFFLCAAAITGSDLTLHNLDYTDPQGDKKVLEILKKMGADYSIDSKSNSITINGPSKLKATDIDMSSIPDALPALAATACYAEGTTRLYNAEHTRQKETDRISVMTKELTKLGAKITEKPDGMEIHGPCPLRGGIAHSHEDHRIAMAIATAALAAEAPITIKNAEAAEVTFPEFYEQLEKCTQNSSIKKE
ncbi:3-phosphoshikimate 1-carboxyvinyltransferase [Spirochaetia bacterium 38H-sp]|uniref:3-phosphoshikimate 1-carboxyvinyltransferase n=1 Tax=Rarispira pelagica TaxID=3141764 RepID=A0ABU9UAX7_9SPIR